jgi:hypothetical protein
VPLPELLPPLDVLEVPEVSEVPLLDELPPRALSSEAMLLLGEVGVVVVMAILQFQ